MAAPQGIEEIREVRVQKVNTMKEAGNNINPFKSTDFVTLIFKIMLVVKKTDSTY